jgi:hypothetical protein
MEQVSATCCVDVASRYNDRQGRWEGPDILHEDAGRGFPVLVFVQRGRVCRNKKKMKWALGVVELCLSPGAFFVRCYVSQKISWGYE